ncbi:MAG: hypothetical protein R3F54_23530 [Alphaproteobacteria bacterium]
MAALVLPVAALLGAMHPIWRLGHGAPFLITVMIGGIVAVLLQIRRAGS